ncbi:MAG: winged helix-turn-helix transcriptional regulator [Clostridia bacterium]|nr:winged helix-turn-helix transcriptional regulator [Clostridia bacterium]
MVSREFAEVFKALGQEIRLKIISLLAEHEFCVCEMEEILGITQSAVSQHLRVLRQAGLVEEEKIGQWVFYHLRRDQIDKFFQEWQEYLKLPLEQKPGMGAELKKVKYLEENPKVSCRPAGSGCSPRQGVGGGSPGPVDFDKLASGSGCSS